jgi:GNAT superfamily N-acetyltransferase
MEIVEIDETNIDFIHQFLKDPNEISHHFRYFEKRRPEDVLGQHVCTFVGLDRETKKCIAYGHIDYEEKFWLGICVHKSQCGKGYGKQMIVKLLGFADKDPLHLSVDSDNSVAIRMYETYGFVETKRVGNVVYMKR